MKYEVKIGIESHFELLTKSKLFCGCAVEFGKPANTQCCPVCLGLPGSLPVLNRQAINLAIKAGIATHCDINSISGMDRKNYFYPDLSKGYQITQQYMPICKNGYININNKKIHIDKIHIEEDAGKLVYKGDNILIDYNRCGVPLIEIVSKPDISSADEAGIYIEKLVDIMRYVGVSDCKMQEGSMRCDVNVSIKKYESNEDGTRVELKNLNSIKFITKAIEYEVDRQISELEKGNKIEKETRRYNELTKKTEVMRLKENESDYRYFKDPDLVDFDISKKEIDDIRSKMPEDFDIRFNRYVKEYGLSVVDARNLLKYIKVSNYFDEASQKLSNKKIVSNLILSVFFSHLKTKEQKLNFNVSIISQELGELCILVENSKVDLNFAKDAINKALSTNDNLQKVLNIKNITKVDQKEIETLCDQVLSCNEKAINDYCKGKNQSLQYLIGEVLKLSKRALTVSLVEKYLKEKLVLITKK